MTFLTRLVRGAAHCSETADSKAETWASGAVAGDVRASRFIRIPENRARTRRSGATRRTSATSRAPPPSARTLLTLQNSRSGSAYSRTESKDSGTYAAPSPDMAPGRAARID